MVGHHQRRLDELSRSSPPELRAANAKGHKVPSHRKHVKGARFIADGMLEAIEAAGPKNIVCITDSAAVNELAGELIAEKYPWIG